MYLGFSIEIWNLFPKSLQIYMSVKSSVSNCIKNGFPYPVSRANGTTRESETDKSKDRTNLAEYQIRI